MKNIKWSCPLNKNLMFVATKDCDIKYSEVMNRLFKINNSYTSDLLDEEIKEVFSDYINYVKTKR
jgi:YesN/AraC family two-component response regulator